MSSYIQNYGFTKTLIQDNNNRYNKHSEIKWIGDYDGRVANIDVDINDNGNEESVNMQLNNHDLRAIFGIQPVEIPLEKRLQNDFLSNNYYKPKIIALERDLIKKKTRRNKHKKKHNKKRKTRRY